MKTTKTIEQSIITCDLCGKEQVKTVHAIAGIDQMDMWFCGQICHSYYNYPTKQKYLDYLDTLKAQADAPRKTQAEFDAQKEITFSVTGEKTGGTW